MWSGDWERRTREAPSPGLALQDVTTTVVVEDDREPRVRPTLPSPPGWARTAGIVALLLAALAATVLIASAVDTSGSAATEDVKSFWGDIDMTCATTRIEQRPQVAEAFRCRSTDGRKPPPGYYDDSTDGWTDGRAIVARHLVDQVAQ